MYDFVGTRSTIRGALHFFSAVPHFFGSLRSDLSLGQKLIRRKIKLLHMWMKHPMAWVIERKSYTQKKNVVFFRRFWVKEPRHSETVIARKRYTLIWRIYDGFGLRSPVTQKTLSPERGRKRYHQKEVYLNMAYLRRFWIKEPRHLEKKSAKKRYTSIVGRVSRRVHHTDEKNELQMILFSLRVVLRQPAPNFSLTKSPVSKPAPGRIS